MVDTVHYTPLSFSFLSKGMDKAIAKNCAGAGNINYQLCDDLRNPKTASNYIQQEVSNAGRLDNLQPKDENVSYNYYVFWNKKGAFFKVSLPTTIHLWKNCP